MTAKEMTINAWASQLFDRPLSEYEQKLLEILSQYKNISIVMPKDTCRTNLRRMFDAHKVLED